MSPHPPDPASVESVEKLAEAIAGSDVGGFYFKRDVTCVVRRISAFLRSHGIDPATMKPMENGEKGQSPADAHSEALRRSAEERRAEREAMQAYIQGAKSPSPPPPQPEVAVSERDRELAKKMRHMAEDHNYRQTHFDQKEAERIIADHMATERAEAAAWETAAKANADALAEKITQLAETEAKLRESENRVRELSVRSKHRGDVLRKVCNILEDEAWNEPEVIRR